MTHKTLLIHDITPGLIFVGLMFCLIGGIALWGLIIAWQSSNWLKSHPEKTGAAKGQITGIQKRPPDTIYIAFQFTDEQGATRKSSQTLRNLISSAYFNSAVGDTIEIVYNRNRPGLNFIKGYEADFRQYSANVIPLLMFMAAFCYLIFKCFKTIL